MFWRNTLPPFYILNMEALYSFETLYTHGVINQTWVVRNFLEGHTASNFYLKIEAVGAYERLIPTRPRGVITYGTTIGSYESNPELFPCDVGL
jgi:hypothetical protein